MAYIYSFLALLTAAGAAWVWCIGKPLFDKMGEPIILTDAAYVALAIVLPLIFLAMIGIAALAIGAAVMNRRAMLGILRANRASLDGLQVVSRQLIEVRKLGASAQFMQFLPMALNDVSASLAEVLLKADLASEVVLFDALSKEGEARLAAVTGVLLSLRSQTPHFDEVLRRRIAKDEIVRGAIAVFEDKYLRLAKALRDHDSDKILERIVEEGPLGRTHLIIARAAKAAVEAPAGV
ncbi:MAG: hypothetical protein LBL52_00810 [Rickettsiales bacterium]|jgi:hypothetical protein|nr:hypothetical protein [Rickettsiales bacterium]